MATIPSHDEDCQRGLRDATDDLLTAMIYLGEDPLREGLEDTPRRVAKAWLELMSGYHQDPADIFTTFEKDGYEDLVIVKDIPFYSMCEHHLLPFFGHVHIGYIPHERIVGLSKLARLVEIYSHRLQVQERLTRQVAEELFERLEADAVMVVVEAEHLCMAMRGVAKPGTLTITSAVRGHFVDDSVLRGEFLSLIARKP